jgi:hypothetical protein
MIVEQARKLRRETTEAERILWRHIRDRKLAGLKFRRQHPFGRFITDFCCEEEKLVVDWTVASTRKTPTVMNNGHNISRSSGTVSCATGTAKSWATSTVFYLISI